MPWLVQGGLCVLGPGPRGHPPSHWTPYLWAQLCQPLFLCSPSPFFPLLGAVSLPPGLHLSLHPVPVLQSTSLFTITNPSCFAKFLSHPPGLWLQLGACLWSRLQFCALAPSQALSRCSVTICGRVGCYCIWDLFRCPPCGSVFQDPAQAQPGCSRCPGSSGEKNVSATGRPQH